MLKFQIPRKYVGASVRRQGPHRRRSILFFFCPCRASVQDGRHLHLIVSRRDGRRQMAALPGHLARSSLPAARLDSLSPSVSGRATAYVPPGALRFCWDRTFRRLLDLGNRNPPLTQPPPRFNVPSSPPTRRLIHSLLDITSGYERLSIVQDPTASPLVRSLSLLRRSSLELERHHHVALRFL